MELTLQSVRTAVQGHVQSHRKPTVIAIGKVQRAICNSDSTIYLGIILSLCAIAMACNWE